MRTSAFDGKLAVALIRIETGRTHQIRVHLKHRRTPVAGDVTYGSADWNRKLARADRVDRPLLHAYQSTFTHPFTGADVTIQAPIPPDIRIQIQRIGGASSPLLHPETSLLLGSTEVLGKAPGEKNKGLVSVDSLGLDEACC